MFLFAWRNLFVIEVTHDALLFRQHAWEGQSIIVPPVGTKPAARTEPGPSLAVPSKV